MRYPSLAILISACSLGLIPGPVSAATFNVNSMSDLPDFLPGNGVCEATSGGGDCTVRAAVMETNALTGADTVNIPAGTYVLNIDGSDDEAALGDLDIVLSTLTINGAGAGTTILDANGIDRFFHITLSSVTIQDLTVQGGRTDAEASVGGAFLMTTFAPETASLTLRRIHILDNGARLGGAIRAISGTTVVVEDSLFQGNQTIEPGGGNRTGAAIYCQGCQITLDRTTLTGNGDDLSGKIIEIDGDGQLYMLNSTVSGNPFGGAVRLSNGNALIKFSTLVNNGAQNFSFFSSDDSHVFEVGATILQNDTHDNCQSGSDQPTSLGHNVVGDSSCPFAETGDVVNAPAVLGTLSNNGGPTFTHAPQAGSPAINRVPPASCTGLDEGSPLFLDQRGEMRPFGPNCDSGSVEVSLLPVIDDGFEDP